MNSASVLAQTAAFTYQGRLNDTNGPANGQFDLRFTLFDAPTNGAPVAETLTNGNVTVSGGLFAVDLDFGADVFDGSRRWLEIGVRPYGGTEDFTRMMPRQPITAVPYALKADAANTATTATMAETASQAAVAQMAATATSLIGPVPDALLSSNIARLDGSAAFAGTLTSGGFNGDGSGLQNLDSTRLTGPLGVSTDPVPVGHFDSMLGEAMDVAVIGQYAYVADSFFKLRIYDISNPANPIHISYNTPAREARSITVFGDRVYLAAGLGVEIFDISDPANPSAYGGILPDFLVVMDVAVAETTAYLACNSAGLFAYDVSFPTGPGGIPDLRSFVDDGGEANGLAISGHHVYLANGDDGLRVYDISNFGLLTNIAHIDNGGRAFSVAVTDRHAYLANGADGLRIYDISNPANPINIGHITNGGFALGVTVVDHLTYLANGDDGLRIYDISNPASPIQVAHVNEGGERGGSARRVAVAGHHAYVANRRDGLRIHGLGYAAAPAFKGVFQGNGRLLTGLDASQLTIGRVPEERLPLTAARLDADQAFGGANAFTNPANSFVGNFSGPGVGLTALNASSLTVGTVPDARLPASVAQLDANQTFSGANAFTHASNSFAGSGVGLTDLNAANLTTGTVPEARLPNDIPRLQQNGNLRLTANGGNSKDIQVGDHYRDNSVIAWAKVTSRGTVQADFGVDTVTNSSVGTYEITLEAAASETAALAPIAVAEVDRAPTNAASVRLASVDQSGTRTFNVYINNGNYDPVDNDFIFMVTGR